MRASRETDGGLLQVEQYMEEVTLTIPAEIRGKRWRSVICVELYSDKERKSSRRLWQVAEMARFDWLPQWSPGNFVLSAEKSGRVAMAYRRKNDVCVTIISLDGEVAPLPSDVELDTATLQNNWTNSDCLSIRQSKLESDLGIEFAFAKAEVTLLGANQTRDGWKVSALARDMTFAVILDKDGKLVRITPDK